MNKEEGTDQPNDLNLNTPNQDLRLAVQEHVNNKPGPKPREAKTITIEGEGKVVGQRQKTHTECRCIQTGSNWLQGH